MNLAPRRLLLDAVLILLAGALFGLAVNHRLVAGAFSGRLPAAETKVVHTPAPYPVPADLTEVRELLAAGAVPIDARDPDLFGKGHIPGARSLPLGEADGLIDALRGQLPAGTALVVYCSGYGCPDSFDLGVKLLAAGWREVRVYEGGFPEWRDAGLPVAKGEP